MHRSLSLSGFGTSIIYSYCFAPKLGGKKLRWTVSSKGSSFLLGLMIQKDLLLSIQQEYRMGPKAREAAKHHVASSSHDPEEWWLVMDSLQAEVSP